MLDMICHDQWQVPTSEMRSTPQHPSLFPHPQFELIFFCESRALWLPACLPLLYQLGRDQATGRNRLAVVALHFETEVAPDGEVKTICRPHGPRDIFEGPAGGISVGNAI